MPPLSRKRSFLPVDSLSKLPPDIIANILGRLPIRRGIQTCILSRWWRYKWCFMTGLYFDEDCVSFSGIYNASLFYNLLARFIDRVLHYHQGQVHEFTIFSDREPYSSDLNQWVYFASQNNVRKLKLSFSCDVMAPSSLFRCSKLMSLDLGPFVIRELSVGFDGFMYLKTLHFNVLVILASSLEKLISGCPILQSLDIKECD